MTEATETERKATLDVSLDSDSYRQTLATEFERHKAREDIQQHEAAERIRVPDDAPLTLEEALDAGFKQDDHRVERLCGSRHNVACTARYKVGKTTLATDLNRCLADGEPFLGKFEVAELEGRVGHWNGEMTENDMLALAESAGIKRTDRISIWNLRGYSIPLLTDAGAEVAVEWLQEREIEVWSVDSLAKLLAWSRIPENRNDLVAQMNNRLDLIKQEAGVKELIIYSHRGRVQSEPGEEHTRGAAVFDDWLDARWILTKEGESRFLHAEGRGGVDLEETGVALDDGRLTVVGGTRREARGDSRVEELVEIVAETPGLPTGDAQAKMRGGDRSAKLAATREAKARGLIHDEPGPANSKLLYPGPSEADRLAQRFFGSNGG